MKPIRLVLPVKPTVEEKVASIELILEQFLDKTGKFNTTDFTKAFYEIQKAIQDKIPDWQASVSECPLFADDTLTENFINVMTAANPKPTDFSALGDSISFQQTSNDVKQFSSVEMRHNIPPVGEEIIVFHPGYQCCVQGIVDEITPCSIHIKNLSVGNNFSLPLDENFIKWLPADRYNSVKTTETTVKVVKGFSKQKDSELTTLIKEFIGD